jgi:hypothetical protein
VVPCDDLTDKRLLNALGKYWTASRPLACFKLFPIGKCIAAKRNSVRIVSNGADKTVLFIFVSIVPGMATEDFFEALTISFSITYLWMIPISVTICLLAVQIFSFFHRL